MEPPVLVLTADPGLEARADDLAADLGLSRADRHPAGGLALHLSAAGLALSSGPPPGPGPVRVDLVGGALGHRLRQGVGRREPLPRAVGLSRGRPAPAVLDATAGLGRDACVLAAAGCRVQAWERSPVLAALLADGLERARQEPALEPLVGRLDLRRGDARQALTDPTTEPPDVVLLDPMFPERRKTARVRKEMVAVRRLVGDDQDAPELLAAALARARLRVVVKRPAGAGPLPGPRRPDHHQDGGQTRFDVYLSAGRDPPAGTPRRP